MSLGGEKKILLLESYTMYTPFILRISVVTEALNELDFQLFMSSTIKVQYIKL